MYAYDAENSETITMELKKSIYPCDNMDYSLLNPIQSEEVGVRFDTRPK